MGIGIWLLSPSLWDHGCGPCPYPYKYKKLSFQIFLKLYKFYGVEEIKETFKRAQCCINMNVMVLSQLQKEAQYY